MTIENWGPSVTKKIIFGPKTKLWDKLILFQKKSYFKQEVTECIATILENGIIYGARRNESISFTAWGLESLSGWVGLGDCDTYLMIEAWQVVGSWQM